jgi:hypothetical protein
VIFGKEYIMRCSSAERIAGNGCWGWVPWDMPSWCRQVNWVNCVIPWVNCAVLCVKDDWKRQFWGLRYSLSKPRSFLSFFPSGMAPHSKIAQFNWECIGCLTLKRQLLSRRRVTVRSAAHSQTAQVFTVIDANGMNYDHLVPTWHRLRWRFSNCGPRTTSGSRVLPLWLLIVI